MALGHCWAFAGSVGNVTIRLPNKIVPTHVSLDHVSIGVARDYRSAPQNFRVWVTATPLFFFIKKNGNLLHVLTVQ